MIKDDDKLAARLARNQRRAMREIEKEIEAFYGRYASKEGITMEEARKRVAKADIEAYRRKAKRYVKEKNFSPRANEEMRLYNVTMRINRLELLMAELQLEMVAMANEEHSILLSAMTERARAEFKRLSAILGVTVKYNEKKLKSIVNEKKLKSIVNSSFFNATWSDRLWNNQDALRSELDRLLNQAIIQGKNPREVARDLRKRFDASIYDSERLMRTEMARIRTDVFVDTAEQVDVEQYEWVAEPTACDECAELDGKVFELNELRIGENAVPKHPNCMCALALYVDRDEWEKELEERGL